MLARTIALAGAFVLALAGSAEATSATNDQAAFNIATSGLTFTTEDFNSASFAPTTSATFGLLTLTSTTPIMPVADSLNCVVSNCIRADSDVAVFGFSFSQPVHAFSFFVGNDDNRRTMTAIFDDVVSMQTVGTGESPGLEPTFFGFYDLATPFSDVKLFFPENEAWNIDNVAYSVAPVPVPPSLPAVAALLAAFGLWRRRGGRPILS